MILKKYISAFLFLFLFIMLLGSCKLKVKTIEPYLISIDSVYAPDTVNLKTLFHIKIFGFVGPSKCYYFEKAYHYVNEKNEITIEAWGKYTYDGSPCAEELIFLNDSIEVAISTAGVYNIKGFQPNLNYAERKLVVKAP